MKARNSAAALQIAAAEEIDAVLADYHLGDKVDGLELLRRIKEASVSAPAVALITADHGASILIAARAAGYPLLHKPLRPAALRALLSAFRRRASQPAEV
jgi:DNA-binding response OmpR family regulator